MAAPESQLNIKSRIYVCMYIGCSLIIEIKCLPRLARCHCNRVNIYCNILDHVNDYDRRAEKVLYRMLELTPVN